MNAGVCCGTLLREENNAGVCCGTLLREENRTGIVCQPCRLHQRARRGLARSQPGRVCYRSSDHSISYSFCRPVFRMNGLHF